MEQKIKVGIVFGGRSVEHEVSIITALQTIQVMDKNLYDIVPIYISKQGEWFTGDVLLDIANYRFQNIEMMGAQRAVILPDTSIQGFITPLTGNIFQRPRIVELDVIFPLLHGTHGEDGTIQGLLEMADLPYVGCGVSAATIGMSKLLTKKVLRYHNLPVLDFLVVHQSSWEKNRNTIIAKLIKDGLQFPVFVKPSNLGSSIGVSEVKNEDGLSAALDLVFSFDDTALLEEPIPNLIEINCSVIGSGDEIVASLCEQPISTTEFLSYEEKYMRTGKESMGMKGLDRHIPAQISPELTRKIQQVSIEAFQAISGRGIARVDFFVDKVTENYYINELNTTPGSLAFYLWEPSGIMPNKIVSKLINIALEAHDTKQKKIFSYDVGLLEKAAIGGAKFGTKGMGSW